MRAPTFVGTMILSLTKAMHWFETCQDIKYVNHLFCIDQFKRRDHLVRHHLHVTLLVASDDHRDELGSEKPLLSLRRKLFWL